MPTTKSLKSSPIGIRFNASVPPVTSAYINPLAPFMFRRLCSSFSLSIATKPKHALPFQNPINKHLNFQSFSAGSRFFSSNIRMNHTQNAALSKAELLRSLEASLGHSFNSNPVMPPPNPLIIVISGPSGVGKDAVIRKLRESRDSLHFVVTATSRPMRPGEVDGKDYFFVSKEEFLTMVEKNELLEYALVYGDYKGIPKKQIREYMAKGYDIVLRVDIQGAETLRRILGDSAVFVFLVAESETEMVERLVERKTESKEELLVRIATAREEVKHMRTFDYVVVNAAGKLDNAVKLVESIIDAEKAKVRQRSAVI